MKRNIILLLCLLCFVAQAQQNLSGSRTTGARYYIYQLTDAEALSFYHPTGQNKKHKKTYEQLLRK
ncbi:hypothetical protein [Chitinophaga niastensis]|uniref:hypothetical protein n=1 Tax=Chitinophaga niastensis TaxID=536980 RepID=UPI000D0D3BC4|nr:hypothetical protein [Chitinophaga niastensis]